VEKGHTLASVSRRTIVAIAVAVSLVAASASSAHLPQYTYASGRNGAGGTFPGTNAYNHRDYNQVWHNTCCYWQVYYVETSGYVHGWVRNSSNPTRWGGEIGYATPKCHNENDNSYTLWTCQSTGG
jgi:hypothetical protein